LRIAEILNQCQIYLSFISELELLSFRKLSSLEERVIKDFLNDIIIIDINEKIKDFSLQLRKNNGLKLPDAIIAGTAQYLNVPLLTADQEFKNIENP